MNKRFKGKKAIETLLPFIKPKRKITYPSQCTSINTKGQIVDDETGNVLDFSGVYPIQKGWNNPYTFSFDMESHLQEIQRKKSDFLNEVDQAIKDYFMFKYNTDLNEIERIKNNVNNLKLNSRFQKVVQLSSGQENYYDGDFLFLTVVNHPLKENLIIRHGWGKEEK